MIPDRAILHYTGFVVKRASLVHRSDNNTKIRGWIVVLCASYYLIMLYKNAHHTASSIPALLVKQSVIISCAYRSRSTTELRIIAMTFLREAAG